MSIENADEGKGHVDASPQNEAQDANGQEEATKKQIEPDLAEQLASWKTKAQAAEQAAKQLAEAQTKLAEKTAQFDELSAKMADYERRAQQSAWRDEVAKELDVPADVLRGETLEELKAHGQQLKELIKPKAPVVLGIEREPESGSLSKGGKQAFIDLLRNQ